MRIYHWFFKIVFCLLIFLSAFLPGLEADAFVRKLTEAPLDFSLARDLPQSDEIVYGYSKKLFTWNDWLSRPSSGPLLVPTEGPEIAQEVFEARSAGIVHRPINEFTEAYLNNIETVKRLDPQNQHQVITGQRNFTVESTVLFPPTWSTLINGAKKSGFLAEKTIDRLIITSAMTYLDLRKIPNNGTINNIVNRLNIYHRKPDIISLHGLVKINQIARFGSFITFFYALDNESTLIVNYFALGIKKKDLDKRFLNIDVRGVLLGESVLNSKEGIGSGLPRYVEYLFRSLFDGLAK